MKHTLFITSFLLLFNGTVQAQWPTVQELVDVVATNYRPIQRVDVEYVYSRYTPERGQMEPPVRRTKIEYGTFTYLYPDHMIKTTIDTLASDTLRVQINSTEGNHKYKHAFYLAGIDTLQDLGRKHLAEISNDEWYRLYFGFFPGRFFFQCGDYIAGFDSAYVSANPEPDVYVITVTVDRERGIHAMKELYVDYSRGTILQIVTYDRGNWVGSIESPVYGGEQVFSDFQQINGIWFPLQYTNEEPYIPQMPSYLQRAARSITTFTITVTD